MIAALVIGGTIVFALAYRFYGDYLCRTFAVDDTQQTPAYRLRDDRDYCPTKRSVLFGHHFSSIAGAGPIVGPIIATSIFGWLPAVLWIVLGAIFVGGVHDFGSLIVSVRNRAQSISHVAGQLISPFAAKLFLAFVWLALVYVLVVFLDLTASTFAPPRASNASTLATATAPGGAVATASILVIALAIGLGLAITRFDISLRRASLFFVPLLFAALFVGNAAPLSAPTLERYFGDATTTWRIILLLYCAIASVAPIWLLLQPRDYLSAYLLYACLGGGLLGIAMGAFGESTGLQASYPAFLGFHSDKLGYLFPALFITVACGACSGFHSIVASGTTAKQLRREHDAKAIGYGAMLVEGILALVSVATVAVLAPESLEVSAAPTTTFATGLSRFLAVLGVSKPVGHTFAMLSLSTFLLTTLDTCTRLGRYVLAELLGTNRTAGRWWLTFATLLMPAIFSVLTFRDAVGNTIPAWKLIWPVFGATNQLLGGLALVVLTVWLKKSDRPMWITAVPGVLMIAATIVALVQLIMRHRLSIVGSISILLLGLALVLLAETSRALRKTSSGTQHPEPII